ncbi:MULTISPECIES: hypothetical protein [Lysinibacillus]|nr:hypothetical protein [Lysinibacillus sphaericus]
MELDLTEDWLMKKLKKQKMSILHRFKRMAPYTSV